MFSLSCPSLLMISMQTSILKPVAIIPIIVKYLIKSLYIFITVVIASFMLDKAYFNKKTSYLDHLAYIFNAMISESSLEFKFAMISLSVIFSMINDC